MVECIWIELNVIIFNKNSLNFLTITILEQWKAEVLFACLYYNTHRSCLIKWAS